MSSNNAGKRFEKEFSDKIKQSFNGEVYCHRIKDTDLSYNDNNVSTFTPKNPCDFYFFYKGILMGMEMKSSKYKSMTFDRELPPKGTKSTKMIKYHQIKSLQKMSEYENIEAGFILNFRDEDKDIESTYYIAIEDFLNFMASTDKASINAVDVVTYGGWTIPTEKKRKWFTYDTEFFIDKIMNTWQKGDE